MTHNRPALASRFDNIGTTIFAEMTRLAEQHDAVNLSQGFPDFPGPAFLKDAAIGAIRRDLNQYARMPGELPLVEAIAEDLQTRYGLEYDPKSEVTVFSGATEGIFCAFLALCEAGDEVVVFEPYYDSYRACADIAGATPRFVTLHGPDFRWRSEELEGAFSEKTRMVVVNSPHNPTGRVLGRDELEEIAALCRKYDVICLTDEVYDRLVYDGVHIPMATLPEMRERTITLNSTGKTFSMTGWKIGYATAPAKLSSALVTAHQFVTFAVTTPFQHAMSAAIRAPQRYFDEFVSAYRARRDRLVEGLGEAGFGVTAPAGTYFVLADIRPLGFENDVIFCKHLIEEVGIAAIPPSAFYENKDAGRHLVRFAFCKKDETLTEAIRRLKEHFC